MLADLLNSGCKKSSSLFQDELFVTRSEIPPVRCGGTVSCEGEQLEEEVPDTRYLFKNKKKKNFMNQKGRRIPFCNYIVTLCVGFCKGFL